MGWMKREPRPAVEENIQEISLGTTAAPIALPTTPVVTDGFPEVDRIDGLFDLYGDKLPIVETVSFTSRVPWLKDRPAWIADYAAHYQTSRHFIARGLNQKADYLSQKVSPGDQFNVFKKGKNVKFHLLVDLSLCRMWFYYLDLDNNERVLLKTYRVSLGKPDSLSASGYLTPVGKYELGDKVAIYKPGITGYFQDEKVEMVRVFGTRWLPFDREIEGCSESAKGYGIQGAPWVESPMGLVEDRSKIGKHETDGCIRLSSEDIEEIFSIVITKPTTVELVKDFKAAKLPGFERNIP